MHSLSGTFMSIYIKMEMTTASALPKFIQHAKGIYAAVCDKQPLISGSL